MNFSVFINFDGKCREAVEFYAKAFKVEMQPMMTYGETPGGGFDERDKDRIMYAALDLGGVTVMFMDFPSEMKMTKGDNIQPTLSFTDKAEVERVFHAVKEGGTVISGLEKTFWSELYGMVEDKFGVQWHIMYYSEDAKY